MFKKFMLHVIHFSHRQTFFYERFIFTFFSRKLRTLTNDIVFTIDYNCSISENNTELGILFSLRYHNN